MRARLRASCSRSRDGVACVVSFTATELSIVAGTSTSAADLKFLHHPQRILLGSSNRKAALESIELLVPLCFRSSCQNVLRCITNFGNGHSVNMATDRHIRQREDAAVLFQKRETLSQTSPARTSAAPDRYQAVRI